MGTKRTDGGDSAEFSGTAQVASQDVKVPVADLAVWDQVMSVISGRTTVHDALGITVDEVSADRVVLSVPVTDRVRQPFGLLHGGVSAVLAESAASIGASMNVAPGKGVVGVELNASHLRGVSVGAITAVATPIRRGRTLHVWEIVVTDDRGRDVCRCRCTLAVIDLPTTPPGE